LREVERERARGRAKGLEEGSLKIKEVIEILGAKLKLLLGLLIIEVRGLDFNHNLLVVASSLILCISDYFSKVITMILIVEIRALVVVLCLGM
jgi:hypothetical protein